jgi:MYXO-CTERM domain-containing protein
MADSDTQSTRVAPRVAPDSLVSDIEATRADLARTIDAITDRVAPKNVARRTVERAKQRAAELDPVTSGVVGAVVVVGMAALVVWRRRRR